MRCAHVRGFLVLAAVLVAGGGQAADQAATTPAPAASQTTRVEGAVPDLAGRWLVVAAVTVPDGGGTVVPLPQLWDAGTAKGTITLTVRGVGLPQFVLDAVAAANTRRRPWEPSAGELRRLAADWEGLAPDDRGLAAVETVVMGHDALPEAIRGDDRMRQARFVVQQTLTYRPGPGRPIRDVMLHGAVEPAPFGWRGNYSSLGIAAAPAPVTIPFSGTFGMYRLESVPAAGALERILDAFTGCGRRPG